MSALRPSEQYALDKALNVAGPNTGDSDRIWPLRADVVAELSHGDLLAAA